MHPNIYMQEQLMRERQKPRPREEEQARMLAGLPRHGSLRHLVGRLGTFFVALRTRMHQPEQRERLLIGTGTRTDAPVERRGEHEAPDPS
jgi:hypothetical protein